MNYKFAVLALSLVILFAAAPAFAADTGDSNIAVLDLEMVVQKSEAGKSVQAAIEKREQAMVADANGFKKVLREKELKLINDRKAGQDDKAFEEAKKTFEAEINKSQKAMIEKNASLEKSKLAALKDIQSRIAKISADVADERKLQIIVDRKFVVIAEQKLDITDEVLKRLNASITSIPLK